MPAYLIASPSGSGKSTLGRTLEKRGFKVVDTDAAEGLSNWTSLETGEKVAELPEYPYTQDWMKAHAWLWDKAVLGLLLEAADVTTFFVGGAYNEKDFYPLFEKRFGLIVDNETLTERLIGRQPERYSSNSPELQKQLDWNGRFKDYCNTMEFTTIDSNRTPDEIADDILQQTN